MVGQLRRNRYILFHWSSGKVIGVILLLCHNLILKCQQNLVREGNPQFNLLWKAIPSDEHTTLSAIAEGVDVTGQTSLDFTTIETLLRNAGVSIPRSKLVEHTESLVQQKILGLTEVFHVYYQLELFRLWVSHRYPLRHVDGEDD